MAASRTRSPLRHRAATIIASLPLVVIVMCAGLLEVAVAADPVFCPNNLRCTNTISNPLWSGRPLDWCRVFENQCGKPAADEYCRLRGYAAATVYNGPRRVASNVKTIVAKTGQICSAPHPCDTFNSITCQTYPHFHKPRWNNIPLDWCKTFERDCGKPAADKYCQLKGFSAAIAFKGPVRLPADTTTIVPSSGAICHTPHVCDTFAWIACK